LLAVDEGISTEEYRVRIVTQSELEIAGTDDTHQYTGSKWGRYLRSTETLYNLQKQYRERFVPLRELVRIHRGITTNCDDFFIVSDITTDALNSYTSARSFRDRYGVLRQQVESREIAIIQRSDGVELPIEKHRLRPILKTARDFSWFSTSHVESIDYAVYIPENRNDLSRLSRAYVEAGERESWHRAASFQALQNAGGNWYTLREADIAPILFIKTMQYTPLVLLNDAGLLANQRLYEIYPLEGVDAGALCAVLNSTLFACERYAAVKALGREGAIDIEVFSANALRTPDLRQLQDGDIERLQTAMAALSNREIQTMREGPLSEMGQAAAEAYISRHPVNPEIWPAELHDEARQEIDRIVLKCIGVPEREISGTIERMYNELVEHIRKLRVLELEAQTNRLGVSRSSAPNPRQLADEIWAGLIAVEGIESLAIPEAFLDDNDETITVYLPAANRITREEPRLFDINTVYACRVGRTRIELESAEQLDYVILLAEHGVAGDIPVPLNRERCLTITNNIKDYLELVISRLTSHAAEYSSDEEFRRKIIREGIKTLVRR
jgi:hypothetical protein